MKVMLRLLFFMLPPILRDPVTASVNFEQLARDRSVNASFG
jgi:hypothetical protein